MEATCRFAAGVGVLIITLLAPVTVETDAIPFPFPAAPSPLPPALEPYLPLHGGQYINGHGAAANPDPLRDYVWGSAATASVNASLQLFTILPTAVTAYPHSAFAG